MTTAEKLNEQMKTQIQMLIAQKESIIKISKQISIPLFLQKNNRQKVDEIKKDIEKQEAEIKVLNKQLLCM